MRRLASLLAPTLLGVALYAAFRAGLAVGEVRGWMEGYDDGASERPEPGGFVHHQLQARRECPACHLSTMPGQSHEACEGDR